MRTYLISNKRLLFFVAPIIAMGLLVLFALGVSAPLASGQSSNSRNAGESLHGNVRAATLPSSSALLTSLSSHSELRTNSCLTPPQEIVGWWAGDGNAIDLVNGNNGTLQNGVTFVNGKVGQGFSFNGINQYVEIPGAINQNSTQEITGEAWIKLAEIPPLGSTNGWDAISKDNPGAGPYILRVLNDGSVSFFVTTEVFQHKEINSGPGKVSVGTYAHIAGTYNSSSGALCVYVNGAGSCGQASGPLRANGDTLKIGADLFNQRFFKGEIDEVSVYNRALSASEVQSIYNAGSDGKCKTNVPPAQRPLIFIPGNPGSSLSKEVVGPDLLVWPPTQLEVSLNELTLDPTKTPPAIHATDAIRSIGPLKYYGPLIEMLKTRGGYREYEVNGDPLRRTTGGCDVSQQQNQPTLFVFAYDWRMSAATNAQMLRDYIGCVRRFYPNTEVDILTHSTGGLVARRYVLDNPSPHVVNNFITIAAPWLGAPKAINALETGDFFDKAWLDRVSSSKLKSLVEFFPGVHQLIPSRGYYALGGLPFTEYQWDADCNRTVDGTYTDYTRLVNMLITAIRIRPVGRVRAEESSMTIPDRIIGTSTTAALILTLRSGISTSMAGNQPRRLSATSIRALELSATYSASTVILCSGTTCVKLMATARFLCSVPHE